MMFYRKGGTGMVRRSVLKLIVTEIVCLSALFGGVKQLNAASTQKPNILFIMLDDLGKEWISAYGAEDIRTPRIDSLAERGMKFTNAYSMPQCTPTRVSLLTGKYPWRTGWVNHWDVPRWGVGYFDWKKRGNTTFARVLGKLGYATCAAGKWQINDFRITPDAMKKHGFDAWCMWTGFESGVPASSRRYHDPYINTPEGSTIFEGSFGPDVYTDYLINFMRSNRNKPMCLYYAMALTHTPLVAPPGFSDAKTNKEKHKAMVQYADKLVGKLIHALEELKIRDRTIVIFTTDNGSTRGITGTRNGRKVKGGKALKEERGVCEPFIVSCPGLVPQGVETDALTDFTDLFPTFVELAGGTVPNELTMDGVSIAPLLLGKAKDSARKWIMAMGHHPARLDERGVRGQADFASRVIRDKQFKVWVDTGKTITRLHNLIEDPWEETNLIDRLKREERAALEKFQAVVDALPDTDARPLYEPRSANPWDRKPARSDAKQLPRVLIIGDSISLGYTPFVKKELKGKALVAHNAGNAGDTGRGLEHLDAWLGEEHWDAIHFNWGLWDLCYRGSSSKVYGNRDKVHGKVTFTPEEYSRNLERLVLRLKKTGAVLIFATTTYVPEGEAGRFAGDDKRYNEAAVKIMKKHEVHINPLNSISEKIHKEHASGTGDVHYTAEGYRLLSEPVVKSIGRHLKYHH